MLLSCAPVGLDAGGGRAALNPLTLLVQARRPAQIGVLPLSHIRALDVVDLIPVRETTGPSDRAVARRVVDLVHHLVLLVVLIKHVRVRLIDGLQILALEVLQFVVDGAIIQRIVPDMQSALLQQMGRVVQLQPVLHLVVAVLVAVVQRQFVLQRIDVVAGRFQDHVGVEVVGRRREAVSASGPRQCVNWGWNFRWR